jgi:hypothetical protein
MQASEKQRGIASRMLSPFLASRCPEMQQSSSPASAPAIQPSHLMVQGQTRLNR